MSPTNQRWRNGLDHYRPTGEPINPRLYEVAEIPRDAPAKRFILEHHYSGSYPAARFRFGLYRGPALLGVAVLSVPMNDASVTNALPIPALEGVELGRFVLLDEVPGNGETWFLARCFTHLRREGLAGVVSFSDPCARVNAAGARVFGGHVGTIYQASNGCYLGRGTARTLRLLPDGSVLSPRVISKLLRRERGWEYGAELLQRHGAGRPDGDVAAWARTWIDRLTRPLRHRGNHKYAWPIDPRLRRHLPYGRNPFPKQTDACATPRPQPIKTSRVTASSLAQETT